MIPPLRLESYDSPDAGSFKICLFNFMKYNNDILYCLTKPILENISTSQSHLLTLPSFVKLTHPHTCCLSSSMPTRLPTLSEHFEMLSRALHIINFL